MSTNKIGFNNFKAFGEKMQTFSKKPITLVYGPNSIGKSSLLHSQLYFEYIKESGKFDLNSTQFAGDEFDLNGFDNFVHKKDTKNSINFDKVIINKDEIFSLLDMFCRGLTQDEIKLLTFNLKSVDEVLKILSNLDKDTYKNHSILSKINSNKKFKTLQIKIDSLLKNSSLHTFQNSEELQEELLSIHTKIESMIENNEATLEMNYFVSYNEKHKDYISEHGFEAFEENIAKDSYFRKINNEEDKVIKNRMFEIYTEQWLLDNKDIENVTDIELILFKLMFFNITSFKDEEKENIAQNIMYEIDFFNYFMSIDSIKLNFNVKKSLTQDVVLDITYNVDGEELLQAKQEGKEHKITINKNNKFMLKLNKKYESFFVEKNESKIDTGDKRFNLLNETKNFSMSLLWSKEEKIILNTIQDILSDMSTFLDSRRWKSSLSQVSSSEDFFSPLIYRALLFIINDAKIGHSQYFGPLRFYPTRTDHLIKKEIRQEENLNGKNIWEYIKNSQELQNSLNEILLKKNLFNTSYKVEVEKKFNLTNYQIKDLNFENKTNEEIVELLAHTAKVEDELIFVDKEKQTSVSLRDMGLGNSQMIPFLLLCNHEVNTRFFIEQPELHLHPKIQAELADEFIRSCKENENEFLIETHSEHLLLRIMKRMRHTAEDKQDRDKSLDLTPDNVCLLYVDNDGESTYVQELRLSPKGKLLDHWPNGFFEEGFKERFS